PAFDMVMVPDVRNATQVNALLESSRILGFSGMATFYPPHLEAIHATFTPDATQIARSHEIVAAYEQALARGDAARADEGRTLIVRDCERARRGRARAGLWQ